MTDVGKRGPFLVRSEATRVPFPLIVVGGFMRIIVLTSLVLVTCLAGRSSAQGPGPLGLRSPANAQVRLAQPAPQIPDSAKETEWKTGALVGAAAGTVVMLVGVAITHGNCLDGSACAVSAGQVILPITLFALLGGLIGSAHTK